MTNDQELVAKTSKLFRFGKFTEANQLLDKTLKKDPKSFTALLEQIRSALFQNKINEASDLIQKATELEPKNPRLYALQGIWFLENKQYDGAEAALTWAAEQLPKDATIQLNLAITFRNLGKLNLAKEHIIKSMSLETGNAFAHYEYSKILFLLEDRKAALFELVRSLECDIYFIPGFIALTRILKAEGKIDAAIKLYEDSIRTAPEVEFFFAQLVILYEEKGEYKKALPYSKHLAQLNDTYFYNLRYGIDTFMSGDTKEGERIFWDCIKRNDKLWDAYYNLAEIYLTQLQFGKAEEFYKKAVERLKKQDSRPYVGLSFLAIGKNDDKAAEKYLNEALAINPNSIPANLNMGVVYKKRNDKIKAKEWAMKAMKVALSQNNLAEHKKIQTFIDKL